MKVCKNIRGATCIYDAVFPSLKQLKTKIAREAVEEWRSKRKAVEAGVAAVEAVEK